MPRDYSTLGTPLGADGPWLAAILSVLDEIADLLSKRLPAGDAMASELGPNEILIGTSGSVERQPAEPVKADDTADNASGAAAADQAETDPDDTPDRQAKQPVKVTEPAPDNPPQPEPPPRQGRGGSAEAWQTWATRAGVTVRPGASRNDIIAACVKAGVLPAEQ